MSYYIRQISVTRLCIYSIILFMNNLLNILTLSPTAYFFRGSHGGGWNPPPLVKMHLEVSEANSFLHSHWYIYKELRSKRICSQLQNSGFGGRSKFGREVDLRVEISKIVKIYKEKSTAEFFGGPPKINRGTQSALVFFKTSVMAIH